MTFWVNTPNSRAATLFMLLTTILSVTETTPSVMELKVEVSRELSLSFSWVRHFSRSWPSMIWAAETTRARVC